MNIGDTVYVVEAISPPENVIYSGQVVSLDGTTVVILDTKFKDLIFKPIADVFTTAQSAKIFGH